MSAFNRLLFPALALAALLCLPASSEEAVSYKTLLTPLLSSGETVIGQPIAYPAGAPPIVTSALVTIPPGGETGWHTHEVPLYVYILAGEVTVDYGEKGIRVYKQGDSALEAMHWPHNGMNKGAVPVHMIAVYIGAKGVSNATPASR